MSMSATVRWNPDRQRWTVYVSRDGRRKSIKWVQATLGHSSPELTLRTYSHLMKSEGDEMGFLEEASDDRSKSVRV